MKKLLEGWTVTHLPDYRKLISFNDIWIDFLRVHYPDKWITILERAGLIK